MPLHIEVISPGIVVFTFPDFKRATVEQWGEYILSMKDNLPNRIRGLYDFRQCQMATRFTLEYQNQIVGQLDLPDDTRSAYLLNSDTILHMWTRLIQENIETPLVQVQTFTDYDDAVMWLSE